MDRARLRLSPTPGASRCAARTRIALLDAPASRAGRSRRWSTPVDAPPPTRVVPGAPSPRQAAARSAFAEPAPSRRLAPPEVQLPDSHPMSPVRGSASSRDRRAGHPSSDACRPAGGATLSARAAELFSAKSPSGRLQGPGHLLRVAIGSSPAPPSSAGPHHGAAAISPKSASAASSPRPEGFGARVSRLLSTPARALAALEAARQERAQSVRAEAVRGAPEPVRTWTHDEAKAEVRKPAEPSPWKHPLLWQAMGNAAAESARKRRRDSGLGEVA